MIRDHEVELFYEAWRQLPRDVLDSCLAKAYETGDILTAHLCAARHAEHHRPEKPGAPQAAQPAPRGEGRQRRRIRLPWQAYSLAVAAASSALLWGPLVAAPAVALLYARFRNTAPFWREGNAVVWRSPVGEVRLRAYEVHSVFRDVHGMGPHDFANAVRAFAQAASGVYYDGRRAYVLLREDADAEEARAALRRIGVVLGGEAEPPVPPKAPRGPYLALALAHLALAAVNPFAVVPGLLALLLTVADDGARVENAVSSNRLLAAALRYEELHAIARTSQLVVRRALLLWVPWHEFAALLHKAAARQERLAAMFQSLWRSLNVQVLHTTRERMAVRGEQAYAATGFVEGKSAVFSTGVPRNVAALTFDLAELTPFSLMLLPFDCGPGAVRIGVDDAGRDVCFRPEDLESPHMTVVGKTGSGKTTWTQAVARQLSQRGVRVVAIDPHGHWRGEKINAKLYAPPLVVAEDGVDYLLDVLRAAGVQVFDVHYTVLLNAVSKCGGSVPLERLPECLSRVRDVTTAWAVDAVYGRLLALAKAQKARVPEAPVVVVHTEGDTTPGDVMRLVAWLYYFIAEAKRACPNPPCPYRLLLAIDEGHVLLSL
ncbi:MAG: DUF87 domain-containing protein [Pyrobaculum sp.]